MPLIFGTNGQIHFNTDNEFYQSLGFLAKSDGTSSIHWEHNENQGAWGSEGRIHCYQNINRFPTALSNAFTAGVGNIIHRINCNEYVEHLRAQHGFVLGGTQNINAVRATVPAAYVNDFNAGLVL